MDGVGPQQTPVKATLQVGVEMALESRFRIC